ncbi:MAG: biotin--[acetyl-CoA-carboxylase] ligase [Candidatus Thermoplasmatota archaeon]|nr:biotin--[acetyl-CoA-carboxylase] ligase [Candidatus Thermoplasmatota archaeon]
MGDLISERSLRGAAVSIIGRDIEIIESVVSTNDIARQRAEKGCREGLIVLARTQTGGRGRMGRRFHSPEGGLYMSLVLRPSLPPQEISLLPLLAGLAVSKSISATILLPTTLKWPNDVLLDGRKVSGILVESSIKGDDLEYAVIGVGINANFSSAELPDELRSSAGTLMDATGSVVDLEELFHNLASFFEMLYDRFRNGDAVSLLEEWTERSETIGRDVRVRTGSGDITGTALGLDQTGALLLSVDGVLQRIDTGDVHHLV